jgi:hypothetical protein
MDEHVPKAVSDGLRRRGVDVLTAQEAGLLSARDEGHLKFVAEKRRVIFTQDADFLRLHAAGVFHRGIAYAPQQTSIRTIVYGLMLIFDLLAPEDMVNHIEYL